MSLSRSMAYRYFKALLIGPCIAASLYACATEDSSSVSDPNNSSTNPPGSTGTTEHPAGTITGDATWGPGNHTVDGTITFTAGTLTIQEGATIIMTSGGGTSLLFGKNAALVVAGSAASPVLITSSSPTPAPGDWGTIDFQVGSLPSQINNANIVYGGPSASNGAVVVEAGTNVQISNTAVELSGGFGVLVTGDANINGFVGNTLTHNTSGPISLTANSVSGLGKGTYTPNVVEGIDVAVSQLSQNANWIDLGVPYVLEGLTIETLTGQAVLNVAAGITLLMAQRSTLVVQKNAGLILAGTQEAPITVTSAASPAARGDWADIEFYTNSLGSVNSINWAEIEYGGGSGAMGSFPGEVWLEADSTAAINNTIVTNSLTVGISVDAHATLASFSNNTLYHNASYPIQIDVDDVRQLQGYSNIYVPNDQTGIAISGSPLHTSTTWSDLGVNYFIRNLFNVDFGVNIGRTTLTLDTNAQITFASGQGLNITDQGQLIANGQSGQIQFNGQGAQPGDGTGWSSLNLGGGPNELHNVRVRFGGLGSQGSIYVDGSDTMFDGVDIPVIVSGTPPCGYLVCGGLAYPANWDPRYNTPPPPAPTESGFGACDPNMYCPH